MRYYIQSQIDLTTFHIGFDVSMETWLEVLSG